ncbi:unnamed protein product [Darwinula stevensoni]|uniref:MULE transposase domain-containing protein n=1 Tax=Darwinula stevensoni TaxID=69355 RepID=A0A7R9A8J1_9CRUS|nr:unnamed protein product [Darwinula stevensoni]CAG0896418.1 unnamed protein product [Darwinula stevensoni]
MDSPPVQIVKGPRGGEQLIHKGFLFRLNRREREKTYWKCVYVGCLATVTTQGKNVTEGKPHVIHTKEEAAKQLHSDSLTWKIRERVTAEPHTSIPLIYREEAGKRHLDDPDASEFTPPFQTIKSGLYKRRRKTVPPAPTSLEDVRITGDWELTLDGRVFSWLLNPLSNFTHYVTTPRGKIGSHEGSLSMPVVFAFLPDKRMDTYRKLFQALLEICTKAGLSFSPKLFLLDFERAVITTLQLIFPSAMVKGCYFHFTQAIYRKVQELGISGPFMKSKEVKLWIRRVMALPFIPLESIDDVYLWIIAEAPSLSGVQEFLDYLVETWIDDEEQKINEMHLRKKASPGDNSSNKYIQRKVGISKAEDDLLLGAIDVRKFTDRIVQLYKLKIFS